MSSTAGEVVTRPSWRALATLAGPLVISRSSQAVVGFTDAAMVGQLGDAALAATTTGATNAFNLIILPMGTVFVVQSFASQLTGRGDAAGARRYAWYGLAVALLTQLLCLAVVPFLTPAVGTLAFDEDVKLLMVSYLSLRLLSGGAAVGLEAIGNYYGGLGNTRLPMVAQLVAMVLNIILNWVLIYGNLGAPALGVEGSAIASAISTTAAFVLLWGLFATGVGCSTARTSGFSLAEFVRLLRFGLPAGFNWFVEFAAFSFFVNVVMAGLGTTAVAAMMGVMQLNSVSFMPAFALASAGAIFVGQAIGARRHDDAPHTVWLTVRMAGLWMGLLGLLYLAFPEVWLKLFVGDRPDPEVFIAVGKRMLMLSCAWQLFDAAGMVLSEALRAAGDTAFTFWARAAVSWGVFVPGALLTVHHGGGDLGAMAWLVIYLALLAGVLWWRFRSGKWRDIALTEDVVVV